MNDAVRLDHGIQSERRPAFSLAPATMTTMYEKRSRGHAVADKAAVAATIERKDIAGNHHLGCPLWVDTDTHRVLKTPTWGNRLNVRQRENPDSDPNVWRWLITDR